MSDVASIPGVWAVLPHLTRTHFVPYREGTRKPAIASLCGCARTNDRKPSRKWDTQAFSGVDKPLKPYCKRCQEVLAKSEAAQLVEDPHTHTSEIQMSLTVRQDSTAIAWVPVPDVELVIDMLARTRSEQDQVCKASQASREGVIDALKVYVHEAKERNEKSEITTWVHTGEKE